MFEEMQRPYLNMHKIPMWDRMPDGLPMKVSRNQNSESKKLFIPGNIRRITIKGEGVAIGSIGFEEDKRRVDVRSLELGYSLSEKYWGQGIMTEAGLAVIKYTFENTDVEVISITTAPKNERSKKVIEKLGFKYEGCLRHSYRIYDGRVRDTLVYSMMRQEWEEWEKERR